jgi:hypothetical protein
MDDQGLESSRPGMVCGAAKESLGQSFAPKGGQYADSYLKIIFRLRQLTGSYQCVQGAEYAVRMNAIHAQLIEVIVHACGIDGNEEPIAQILTA